MVNSVRPPLPGKTYFKIINDLARSLPSFSGMADLAKWEENDWLAAEWVVYWQNAASWFIDYIRETGLSPPAPVWERLQLVDTDSRERTRRMLIETTEILTALESAGILVLPIKGAVVAPVYYPDPTVRPLGDIDVLIHEKDIQGGREVLEKLGYTFFSRSAKDYVYLRGSRRKNVWAPDNVHPVEIHFRLDWYQTTGMTDQLSDILWGGSGYRSYSEAGQFLLPSHVGNFLAVCAHATTDRINHTAKLIQILDILLISERMSADDWSELLEKTNDSLARLIYPGLALASKYAPIMVPPEVIWQLNMACPHRLQEWVAQIEFAHPESNGVFSRGVKVEAARILGRTPAERWILLWRLFFPRRWDLFSPGKDLFQKSRISRLFERVLNSPLWPACYAFVYAARFWYRFQNLFVSGNR